MTTQTRADPHRTIQAWEILAPRGSEGVFRGSQKVAGDETNVQDATRDLGAMPASESAEVTTSHLPGKRSDHIVSLATASRNRAPEGRSANGWMTIPDICDELGVARSTFYEWKNGGKGPRGIKLPNGSIRVRRNEFERWLKTLEEER